MEPGEKQYTPDPEATKDTTVMSAESETEMRAELHAAVDETNLDMVAVETDLAHRKIDDLQGEALEGCYHLCVTQTCVGSTYGYDNAELDGINPIGETNEDDSEV